MLDLTEKYFGKVARETKYEIVGEDAPIFTGSQVQIRDDDLDLAHMGIFYEAPSSKHEDYWAFLILQRIMGNYEPAKDAFINHP